MALVRENTTSSAESTGDFNWNHTGTGSDLVAIVLISVVWGAAGHTDGVTYNGVSMTEEADSVESGVWSLGDVPSGVQNVSVDTIAGASSRADIGSAITLTGADTADFKDAVSTWGGSSDTTPEADITTVADNSFIFSSVGSTTGGVPTTTGTGHTLIVGGQYSLGAYGHGYVETTTAGVHTLGYSISSQTNDVGTATFSVKPLVEASASPSSNLTLLGVG